METLDYLLKGKLLLCTTQETERTRNIKERTIIGRFERIQGFGSYRALRLTDVLIISTSGDIRRTGKLALNLSNSLISITAPSSNHSIPIGKQSGEKTNIFILD